MRKAIILTLVLACIALFAVACQQQPQAGRAFNMPRPGDYAAPTQYQQPVYDIPPPAPYPEPAPYPAPTQDYGAERPATTGLPLPEKIEVKLCITGKCPDGSTITSCEEIPKPLPESYNIGENSNRQIKKIAWYEAKCFS